jgi:uncharacterized membrane protein YkvA (DUF1232 family)
MSSSGSWSGRLREWARRLEREVVVLWICTRHPRTPLLAKALAVAVVAYALSPIDLIPDFIPVLGYLDDLLIVPVGIWLVLKLVPREVMAECRVEADLRVEEWRSAPRSRRAAAVIVVLWLAALALLAWLAWWWLRARPAG